MTGVAPCAVVSRRPPGGSTSKILAVDSAAAQGCATATPRGVRSCSNSSVACTMGSAWNRARIAPSRSASAMATIVMP